jgi:glycolate oxidase iron-sulfur subunit
MLLLEGCVQPAMAPNINIATARVLDTLGISLEPAPGAGCCGALRHHLNAQEAARNDMRRNIDAWWPALEAGAEAVVINTSGCAPQVKDYATLLSDDPEYAAKARDISANSFDIVEILQREETRLLEKLTAATSPWMGRKLAFQSPCTLQHGQGITGMAERLLIAAGCDLVPVADGHLCCGSAGTYSIFQPTLSKQLRANKVSALTAGQPEAIATANIGCLSHLQPAVDIPVRHWVEIIDEALSHSKSGPTEA